MNTNDPERDLSTAPAGAGDRPDLARELRLLRYAEPAPELRRQALEGAARILGEQDAAPYRRSLSSGHRHSLAAWWPELALAAAATLLFSLSGPAFVAGPAASPAPTVAPKMAPIGIASQLGLGQDLGGYLEQRLAAAKGPAAPSRLAGLS